MQAHNSLQLAMAAAAAAPDDALQVAVALACVATVVGLAMLARFTRRSRRLPGSATTLPNGLRVQSYAAGETNFLWQEVFVERSYCPANARVSIAAGDTVLDVGANVGMFSLFAACEARGDVTVHAFEPVPRINAILTANLKLASENGIPESALSVSTSPARRRRSSGAGIDVSGNRAPRVPRMVAHRMALSDSDGELTLLVHPSMSLWSSGVASFDAERGSRLMGDVTTLVANARRDHPWSLGLFPAAILEAVGRVVMRKLGDTERVTCPQRTLSSILPELDPPVEVIDLLKIDVEGAELSVLRGISDSDWERVRQVVLEVETKDLREAVCELLKSHGFDVQVEPCTDLKAKGFSADLTIVYAVREP